MIHTRSARRKEPFVKVNCAAIPRDLLEAELFGYEKGAFTGAHKTKPGRFEVANKGTMFLDEIGDMPMELQSKLLQVLEQQEFVRVGGINNIHVDVRIVCATNKNLEEAIAAGQMRDDLFYRLNEITVTLPSLRNRRSDIPLLVDHFLEKLSILYGKTRKEIKPETMRLLQNHDWPGNVRQLKISSSRSSSAPMRISSSILSRVPYPARTAKGRSSISTTTIIPSSPRWNWP